MTLERRIRERARYSTEQQRNKCNIGGKSVGYTKAVLCHEQKSMVEFRDKTRKLVIEAISLPCSRTVPIISGSQISLC